MLFIGGKLRVASEIRLPIFDFGLSEGNLYNICDIGKINYVYYLEGVVDIFQAFYHTQVSVIFLVV